uniref:NB-ARC domain-containing protein n=1 Tax=Oryza barthii TaxID=65489 RepID=A0A0D3HS98_9ORYZ
MASSSSGVMNSLLTKLATLIREECYSKLKGVRNEVVSLEGELRSMEALLEKLACMDELDVQVKEWRDQKTTELPRKLRARHQIAKKIEEIKNHVKEVNERRMRYKLDEYTSKSSCEPIDPRVVTIYANTADLVGIDIPRDEVVKLLMGDDEQQLKVASIVGFGGLGKTTLANEVYRKLDGHFHCRAFVSVSQRPDITRLMSKVLSELTGQYNLHIGELDNLLKVIREYLQDKRYLFMCRYFIVIDDLWDSSAWNVIRCAFPENNHGSRVLTTTRIYSVAISCCSNKKEYVYNMSPLGEVDSRRLLFSRIFGTGEACSEVFEEISGDILKRCGGLPLAIMSISSLLAGQSKTKWEYVRNSLGSMFERNPTLEDMKHILDFSYRNLPQHLKTCLLYLSIYPEDHTIERNDLVRQWMAECFVSRTHGLDSEDVAQSYFNELINRSMIQTVQVDYNYEVLSCRVHDIMLDFIRSKSAEENFIVVLDHPQVVVGAHKKIHRVSVQYDADEEHGIISTTILGSLSQVRSIAVFRSSFRPSLLELKHLRVLHLELPMREVMIRGYYACFKLGMKIRQLLHLETFDLGESFVPRIAIPSDIVHLPCLLHLVIPCGTTLPDGIGSLKSLRTLTSLDLALNSVNNIECLGELTNLRHLGVHLGDIGLLADADVARRLDALCSSLESLSRSSSCLRSLDLDSHFILASFDRLSDLCPSPRHLRRLNLYGCRLPRIPRWISQLHDLYSLVLLVREVVPIEFEGDDGICILAKLPSLVQLDLGIRECPEERIVVSGAGTAFRALRDLTFSCPKPRRAFLVGAMPRLQRLDLRFYVNGWEQQGGTCLPVGIENLPSSGLKVHLVNVFTDSGSQDVISAKSALRRTFEVHQPSADLIFHF